jgi:hypothetical protein
MLKQPDSQTLLDTLFCIVGLKTARIPETLLTTFDLTLREDTRILKHVNLSLNFAVVGLLAAQIWLLVSHA